MDLFMDIVMIEGLMMDLDLTDIRTSLSPGALSNIRDLVTVDIDLEKLSEDVNSFSNDIKERLLSRKWSNFSKEFENRKQVNFEFFNKPEKINPNLGLHPQIQWLLKKQER